MFQFVIRNSSFVIPLQFDPLTVSFPYGESEGKADMLAHFALNAFADAPTK